MCRHCPKNAGLVKRIAPKEREKLVEARIVRVLGYVYRRRGLYHFG